MVQQVVQRVTIVRRALPEASVAALQAALGPAFSVGEGVVSDGDVVVGPPLTEAVLAVLRAQHPRVTVVAIVRGLRPSTSVVEALAAGADACVVDPTVPELAAHLLAIRRRAS